MRSSVAVSVEGVAGEAQDVVGDVDVEAGLDARFDALLHDFELLCDPPAHFARADGFGGLDAGETGGFI